VAGSRDDEANARMLSAPQGRVNAARRKLNYFFSFSYKQKFPPLRQNFAQRRFIQDGNPIFDIEGSEKSNFMLHQCT
jgi:hypothetical protein